MAASCRPSDGPGARVAETLAIGPGPESVGILLYSAPGTAGRWDTATWDGSWWYASGWQSVGCDVAEISGKWGASQESGILTIAEAGELDLRTIDPARELDPINTSSPYYGAVRPGSAIRIVAYAPDELAVATAYIDEVTYDVASARGRIRAIDGIAYLSQAQVPAGVSLPNTLRARVRAVLVAVGLDDVIPVEPDSVSAQQLTNTGFEDAALGAWQLVNAGPNTGIVNYGGSHTGGRVLTVKGPGSYPRAIQRIPCEPGGVYTVAGFTRWNTGAGAKGTIGIVPRDINGAQLPGEQKITSTNANPNVWDPLTRTYTAPADGSVATIEAACQVDSGTTTATDQPLFDDVTLTGPIAGRTLEPDPPVAAYDNAQARPAWQVISDASQDALTYVWLDPTGTLRFRSWGALIDAPINVGCPAPDADAGDVWLEGVSTIESTASGDAVRNSVRAYSSGTTWAPAVTDAISIAKYGPRPFDVPRILPDLATFASRVLADRSDAGLEVAVGEIRPYTLDELDGLLETALIGPSTIRVRDDAHGEVIDLDLALVGATYGLTPAGWRFALATFLSRVSWDAITPEPPIPPIPPAGTWHTETRQYVASSDALIALTSGGAKYGAGASSTLPVGAWSGWTYRGLLAFPAIPWAKVRAVKTATLKLQSTTAVRVGFGSSPKAQLLRITSGWSAGSASSPSSGNAVVWPGPNTTSSGAVTAALPKASNAAAAIRCDAIARAWAPAAIGGSGAGQYGIELREASGSTSNTGEVWPLEKGGAARPLLELVVEVFD